MPVARYTVGEAAQILGLSAGLIRGYVRAGILTPQPGPATWLTVQDLVLLRTVRGLLRTVPQRKLKRALRHLRQLLPADRPLTGVQVVALGEEVVVREGAALWRPDSGQRVINFDAASEPRHVTALAVATAASASAAAGLAAGEWYELGCELEADEPDRARDAYRRALQLDPLHPDASLNLGRLLQETGDAAAAEAHYRVALAVRPHDATAAFNLGVALEDLARGDDAVAAYELALKLDARAIDAHHNLARLHEQAGRTAAAIRHLKACRALAPR